MRARGLAVAACVVASVAPATPTLAWSPPAGIPDPGWGIETPTAPPAPAPWTGPVSGRYVVDESAPGATDEGNPFGDPRRPRRTIPTDLPAGAVVELRGRYTSRHSSPRGITAHGTPSAPVFIRGASPADRPLVQRPWEVHGRYLVLENLAFGPLDAETTGSVTILAPSDHVALRGSDVGGNTRAGGVGVTSWNGAAVEHVVIHANRIHDNGDVEASFDQDVHGIAVGAHVSRLWVVDNELTRNSGDGIQINAGRGGAASTHHVYVGRNVAHHNKQTGFWTKQAEDVVFSENVAHDHRAGNSSYGACMGFQYAPQRVWFIFNRIHDCDVGIGASSDSGLGPGTEAYFVGNVIHAIHGAGPVRTDSAWTTAGLMLAGGVNRYVVDNTIVDVDTGIASPGAEGRLVVAGNVVAGVTRPGGAHLFVEMARVAAASVVHHNLFERPVRIKWGDAGRVLDLTGFRRVGSGVCERCLDAAPAFVGAHAGDFRLRGGSPAIDAGVADPVYERFRTLYGLDIAVDAGGIRRPAGAGWDLGAHELDPGAAR